VITRDQYVHFTGRALDGMIGIVDDLGEDLANQRPALPGANSPYALLTHCLGVVTYWAGWLVAGRPVERDRAAEFTTTGPLPQLLDRARAVSAQLADDVSTVDPRDPLHDEPASAFGGPRIPLDKGGALMHVYEELAQHHGQMEILRDALRAESAR
jgi:Protein of unknown function (DUF664)